MNAADKFVQEVFELAETTEIQQMAEDAVRNYKQRTSAVELKETDIFKAINASYIAARFFGKSRFWICQKLNHNIKNGKRDDFTPEQWETLKKALQTIAFELQGLAEGM